jgi:hypothetical protein
MIVEVVTLMGESCKVEDSEGLAEYMMRSHVGYGCNWIGGF